MRPASRESSVSPTRIPSPTRPTPQKAGRAKSCRPATRTVSRSLSCNTSPLPSRKPSLTSPARKPSLTRSETFTNALINRYDSDAEEEEEDKETKIRNLEKSLKRHEKLVKELQRKLKGTV